MATDGHHCRWEMTTFGARVEKWELLSVGPGCERILGGDASVCKICLVVVVGMQFCDTFVVFAVSQK